MIELSDSVSHQPSIRTLDRMRQIIVVCQYLLLGAITLGLLIGACKIGGRYLLMDGRLSINGWRVLIFPAAFAGCLVGSIIGRFLMSGVTRMGRWYHPVHMFRDWLVLSVLFGVFYQVALKVLWQNVPGVSAVAGDIVTWLMSRGLILGGGTFILLLTLELIGRGFDRFYQPGTMLPKKVGWIFPALILQSILFVASTLAAHNALAFLVKARPDFTSGMALAMGVFIVAVIGYIAAFGYAVWINRDAPEPPEMLTVTLAMVGMKSVGKTVFLTRAYSLLDNYTESGFSLSATDESRSVLGPLQARLEDQREWPTGTVDADEIPFILKLDSKPRIIFDWIDLPGGSFQEAPAPHRLPTNHEGFLGSAPIVPRDRYETQRKVFEERLKDSNAVVMMFSAKDLAPLKTLNQYTLHKYYRKVVDDFYESIEKTDRSNDAVAVAIVITQIDEIKSKSRRRQLRKMIEPLERHWRKSARARNCQPPRIRTFLTSSVANTTITGNPPLQPEPIDSDMCVEVMLWLASQVLRSQAIIFDDAMGFFRGRSAMHQLAIELEDGAS